MRKAETKRYVTRDVAVLFDVSSTPFLLSYGTRLKEGGPHARVTKFLCYLKSALKKLSARPNFRKITKLF